VSFNSNMRSVILVPPALLLLAACSGAGHAPAAGAGNAASSSAPAASPGAHVVTINNFKFQPADLTVKAGDTVEWKNEDIVPHSATDKGVFDSGGIAKGGSWQWVATKPGTYYYICTLHPNMKGRLVVQ
jgi:plastocyanin